MSCFEWSNLSAEYLDGSLAPSLKKRAEEHLSVCRDCSERHQHYRLILESLRSLSRVTTPTDLQHELEAQAPRLALTSGSSISRIWKASVQSLWKSPKTLSITASIVLGLALLAALPKIRGFYEARVQQRLDAHDFAELPLTAASPGTEAGAETIDDFGGEYDENDSEPANSAELSEAAFPGKAAGKNARQEVWRFIIRTDSPQEMRARVYRLLEQSGALPGSRFASGFSAPGGIQFDVLVLQSAIEEIRKELSELVDEKAKAADATADSTENPYPTSPFTWFRNRSKRPLPAGTARVIIWLSLS